MLNPYCSVTAMFWMNANAKYETATYALKSVLTLFLKTKSAMSITSDSDWKKMFKFPRYPCGAFPSVTLTIPGMFFGSKLRLTIGISTDCANSSSAKNHHFREQASSFFMFVRFI